MLLIRTARAEDLRGKAAPKKEERPAMKLITWVALAATAFVALALFAGKDDIRRLRRMCSM